MIHDWTVVDFQRAFAMLDGYHVLPAPGGTQDQAAQFVDACTIMAQQRAHWDEIHDRRRVAEQQRAANAHAPKRPR